MKIAIFGKYPPIQGGVSMRTYWLAHGLAKLGHTVHVITNAQEAGAPYRMYMCEDDWARCEGEYGAGSVKVHWTESYNAREWHIPRGTPFVTKLTSLGLELAYKQSIDIIVSYYVEPYCLAAHIVAQATGLPQVVRTADSDAGRLWQLPQFAACYNHIFKSASAIVYSPSLIPKMISIGVESDRITSNPEKHVNLLELFAPDGPALDVEKLRHEVSSAGQDQFRQSLFGEFDPSLSYCGVYGKLGKAKGTYQLLAALKRMKERGIRAGLLVMAHERPEAQSAFHDYVTANKLLDRVCQLPFLPH
jgi:glycosyltransferase involved in cell wall biosynthesis